MEYSIIYDMLAWLTALLVFVLQITTIYKSIAVSKGKSECVRFRIGFISNYRYHDDAYLFIFVNDVCPHNV